MQKASRSATPILRAGVLGARRTRVSWRTDDGTRTTPIAVIARRCDEAPLKHSPAEGPQNAESSAKRRAS
jgi:hypothetical protein